LNRLKVIKLLSLSRIAQNLPTKASQVKDGARLVRQSRKAIQAIALWWASSPTNKPKLSFLDRKVLIRVGEVLSALRIEVCFLMPSGVARDERGKSVFPPRKTLSDLFTGSTDI